MRGGERCQPANAAANHASCLSFSLHVPSLPPTPPRPTHTHTLSPSPCPSQMFEPTWYKCRKLNPDLGVRATTPEQLEQEALGHILDWLGEA